MVSLGEELARRPHRRARTRPQITATRRWPAEHERKGIHLVEDHDAAAAMATVAQQGGCLDDRLDIFGGRELEARRLGARPIEQLVPVSVIGEGGEQARPLGRYGKALELCAIDHLQKLPTAGARVIARQAERGGADREQRKDHQHWQDRHRGPEALADLVVQQEGDDYADR